MRRGALEGATVRPGQLGVPQWCVASRPSSRSPWRWRWIIERTISWMLSFRWLTVRYERHLELYHAFVLVVCIVITLRAS